MAPRDAIFVTDVGWNKNGAGQQLATYAARQSFLTSGGLATMGFAPAAAIGAKIGAPDRPVICLVGDGGFLSVAGALTTAVELGIPVVWVIFNNFCFSTIRTVGTTYFNNAYGTEFRTPDGEPYNPDFLLLAKAFGVDGARVDDPDELPAALTEGDRRQSRPTCSKCAPAATCRCRAPATGTSPTSWPMAMTEWRWRGRSLAAMALCAALAACSAPAGGDSARVAAIGDARGTAAGPAALRLQRDDGTVSVIDIATRAVVQHIPVGKRPRGIRASPDGRTVYVALSGSPIGGPNVDEATLPPPDRKLDGIGVIDAVAGRFVKHAPVGHRSRAVRRLARTARGCSSPTRTPASPACSRWRAARSWRRSRSAANQRASI